MTDESQPMLKRATLVVEFEDGTGSRIDFHTKKATISTSEPGEPALTMAMITDNTAPLGRVGLTGEVIGAGVLFTDRGEDVLTIRQIDHAAEFTMTFDRERWGVIVDALLTEGTDPERSDICAELIRAIRDEAKEL